MNVGINKVTGRHNDLEMKNFAEKCFTLHFPLLWILTSNLTVTLTFKVIWRSQSQMSVCVSMMRHFSPIQKDWEYIASESSDSSTSAPLSFRFGIISRDGSKSFLKCSPDMSRSLWELRRQQCTGYCRCDSYSCSTFEFCFSSSSYHIFCMYSHMVQYLPIKWDNLHISSC